MIREVIGSDKIAIASEVLSRLSHIVKSKLF